MEAKLIVVGGKANRSEVPLKLPAMLGRGRDADITVAHATVSRHHCLIYEVEGALVVKDNGSLNGTVVDGERIEEAVLRPGRTITVGPLTFRAEYAHAGDFPNLGAGRAPPRAAAPAELKFVDEPAPSTPDEPKLVDEPASPAPSELKVVDEPASPVSSELKFVDEPASPGPSELKFVDESAPAPAGANRLSLGGDDLPVDEPDDSADDSLDDFNFLDDEPVAAPSAARQPPAPITPPAAESDDELFRLADEPPEPAPAKPAKPRPKEVSANGSSTNGAKPKPADRARPEAPLPVGAGANDTVKSPSADDDELNSFLDSLGLEE